MDFLTILLWLACAVEAYLLGSVSFAYVIGKLVVRRDIRKYGSGNAGASNMTRNFGWQLGLLTFILDIAKGSGAALIGLAITGNAVGMAIGAVFAVAGHNWPVFFGFRGGKGIATTLGAALVLMPWEALICLGVAGVIIAATRYMSVGSLVGTLLLVLAAFVFPFDWPVRIAIVVLFLLAVFSHRENLARLAKGTENKMTFGKGRPRRRRKAKTEEVKT